MLEWVEIAAQLSMLASWGQQRSGGKRTCYSFTSHRQLRVRRLLEYTSSPGASGSFTEGFSTRSFFSITMPSVIAFVCAGEGWWQNLVFGLRGDSVRTRARYRAKEE